ncbi:MAG: tetratricopeptide repeat protein [Porphyromonas sp.]|nr:tetratricopeptide repeat protein [Porphyromonas sp.]
MKQAIISPIRSLLFIVVLLCLPYGVKAQREATINEANSAYSNADFEKAIELYSDLIDSESAPTAEMYYNLGCAYFKSGDIGRAILNFERTLRLKPGDKDARHNLKIANSRTLDKIVDTETPFFYNLLDKMATSTEGSTWMMLALLFFLGVCFSIILFFFWKGSSLRKRIFFYTAVVSLVFSLIFNLLAWRAASVTYDDSLAIITAEVVTLKSSPDNASENLSIIHSGIKVRQIQDLNGYTEVSLPDGTRGWLKSEDIEQILPSGLLDQL